MRNSAKTATLAIDNDARARARLAEIVFIR